MDNAERLISKAYEWIDQASHELCWDEGYTKSRKGNIGHCSLACIVSCTALGGFGSIYGPSSAKTRRLAVFVVLIGKRRRLPRVWHGCWQPKHEETHDVTHTRLFLDAALTHDAQYTHRFRADCTVLCHPAIDGVTSKHTVRFQNTFRAITTSGLS